MSESKNISEYRKQIEKGKQDLDLFEKSGQSIPELINSTNILRLNEHLKEINAKKDTMLQAYGSYTLELESLLSSMLQVQTQLKNKLKSKEVKKPIKKKSKRKTSVSRKKTKKVRKQSKSKRTPRSKAKSVWKRRR